jgi:hypothetical protein
VQVNASRNSEGFFIKGNEWLRKSGVVRIKVKIDWDVIILVEGLYGWKNREQFGLL